MLRFTRARRHGTHMRPHNPEREESLFFSLALRGSQQVIAMAHACIFMFLVFATPGLAGMSSALGLAKRFCDQFKCCTAREN